MKKILLSIITATFVSAGVDATTSNHTVHRQPTIVKAKINIKQHLEQLKHERHILTLLVDNKTEEARAFWESFGKEAGYTLGMGTLWLGSAIGIVCLIDMIKGKEPKKSNEQAESLPASAVESKKKTDHTTIFLTSAGIASLLSIIPVLTYQAKKELHRVDLDDVKNISNNQGVREALEERIKEIDTEIVAIE